MPDGRGVRRHRPLAGLAVLIAAALVAAILWASWLVAPLAVLLGVYGGLIVFDTVRARRDPR